MGYTTGTVSLNRIWENEKMNQANGYHSSPDPYVGNQKAPKIEKFHELIWRKLRFFLALRISYSLLGLLKFILIISYHYMNQLFSADAMISLVLLYDTSIKSYSHF